MTSVLAQAMRLTRNEIVRSVLALASKRATLEEIASWSATQKDAAIRWGGREHAIASDNDHLRRLKCPPHVARLPDVGFDADGIWPDVGRGSR